MSSTRIRMYRHGLGDCFLLSFPRSRASSLTSSKSVNVLIDCGVLLGTKDATDKMNAVVGDIGGKTKQRLDYVVGTHEHWDHLSGFRQASELFDRIEMPEVWLGWTEDTDDHDARRLADDRAERIRAVAAAAKKMAAAGLGASAASRSAHAALAFFGIDPLAADLSARGGSSVTRQALEYLRDRGSRNGSRLRFQEPGATFPLEGTDSVRVFVLGPPRDLALIRKDLPSNRAPETYEEVGLTATASVLAALARPDGAIAEAGAPFEEQYRVVANTAKNDEFFKRHYGFDGGSIAPPWRRIDDDYLAATGQMALALDSDTNNTSLVLAFELGDGGPVLLFAADAQVGNWLGWHALTFEYRHGTSRRKVTASDLLNRTILYKVGHHGSHNATLREKGLEQMTDRRLMALIPVDEEMARTKRWRMPFEPLIERLDERCRKRVIRSDHPRDVEGVDSDELAVEVRIQKS